MKKLTRSHTTFLDSKIVDEILNLLQRDVSVKSFTAGIIKVKKPPSKKIGPVKITLKENSLLLRVNTKSANQEIRVYGNNLEEVVNGLKNAVKDAGGEVILG